MEAKVVDLEKVFVKYPEPGKKYRHYKGGLYEVLHLAEHSETGEKLVVYRSVHHGSYHVRPLSMWFEEIRILGSDVPITRFRLEI